MAKLDELFAYLKDQGGSDLHCVAGLEPRIRAQGKLQPVPGWPELQHQQLLAMMEELCSSQEWAQYQQTGDLDFAYALEGVGRFRANFLAQHRGAAAVFRLIPETIVPLEALRLPPAVGELAHLEKGLVLVTGPTGSGKSTTLAAIINEINESYVKHIITIEDPVEFVHTNKKSVFSHREVGRHTQSFGEAMRAALRQDPDVIVVGEMRGVDTVSMALAAAEMGVLVFGTVHTNNAMKTIDRLVDVFPSEQHDQVRLSLADCLAAVVCQLLVPTADGTGRRAVNEILLRNAALPNLIRQANSAQIPSLIQSGRSMGMQLMDDALFDLLRNGEVTAHDAYAKATDKQRFEHALRNA